MSITFYNDKGTIYFPTKLETPYWGSLDLSLTLKRSFFKEGIFFPANKARYFIFTGDTQPTFYNELGVLLDKDGLLHRINVCIEGENKKITSSVAGHAKYDVIVDGQEVSAFHFLRACYPNKPIHTILGWLEKISEVRCFEWDSIKVDVLIDLWKKHPNKLDSILTNMDK